MRNLYDSFFMCKKVCVYRSLSGASLPCLLYMPHAADVFQCKGSYGTSCRYVYDMYFK